MRLSDIWVNVARAPVVLQFFVAWRLSLNSPPNPPPMSNQCLKTAFVSLFNMRKDNDKRGARVVIAVLLITEALEAYVVLFYFFPET